MMADLSEVLSYENENVTYRFSETYGVTLDEANEIFLETKKWLWLCAKLTGEIKDGQREHFRIPLFNEAYAIDLMWHTFLLYSRDYADFCQKYFGFFIHHQPTTKKEREEWKALVEKDPDAAWETRRNLLEKVYGYLYDELGPQTLIKWSEEYPERFNFK